ncbi:MAG: DMT family transporter [Patulibacter sp.]
MLAPINFTRSAPARSAVLLLVAVAGGAGISLQLFLNGRLGQSLGSFELAAAANTTTALLALIVVAALTGTRQRAVAGLRVRPVHRRWHWFIGLSGAYMVLLAAFAAPRLGVALLTVALVCGQTVGSLIVDHFGVSPAGRQPLTAPRVLGALLALVAVSIGAIGAPIDPQPLLLALVVIGGGLAALQQAALGHLARSTGEPIAAGVINFVVGALVLIVVALGLTGGIAPNGWFSAPPIQWLGGLIGALMAVTIARLVPRIGVLRLMLALVAGQTLGAVALDLVAPGAGGVTVATVVGVLLTMVAVTVGSGGSRPATATDPEAQTAGELSGRPALATG